MTPTERHAHHMAALRRQLDNPAPDSDVCLLTLAMTLRGNADGSAEGTADAEDLVLSWDVLHARTRPEVWRATDRVSDAALLAFLLAVLAETRAFVAALRAVRL